MATFQKGQSGNPKGRPRKSDKYERHITKAENQIADRLPQLVNKMFELADGVMVSEIGKDGPVIYQRPPDRAAIQYLMDRIMGKPTERQEVTGENGGAVHLTVFTRALDLAYGDDDADDDGATR